MNPEPGLTLSHYRLVEKIGEGGMGVVWKAEDTVLGRMVAVKVLPAELALDEERRSMFLDEARMASSVSHGNIVQVHEMGRERDLDFIAMEYIEGQPLSHLLHGRPMPPERIADWGLQIAQGMSRAHRKGLLHRDLKPANVLVTPDGEAKIVDFGLAALFAPGLSSATATKPLEGETPERRIAGTLPYMSPEQVRGERLDARSDIFSFGTMLYEMAAGQRPFMGSTQSELASEIQDCRPRPVHELVPKVPVELHRIIEKALARRPEDRYQGMGDMAVDLKRLARDLESGSSPSYEELSRLMGRGKHRLRLGIMTASVVAVAAAAAFFAPRILDMVKKPPAPAPSALAVLPFESLNHSGTEGSRPGFAFSEDVTTRLSRITGLQVLSPVTTQRYAGENLDPARIGKELHAGSILAGSIQEGGDGGWVSAHLITVDGGADLWSGRFRLSAGGMAAVQDSIATGVSEALGIVSSPHLVMPVTARWMKNPQAYAYYLAGMERYLDGTSAHPVADGRAWFDRALEADPEYAPALAMEGEMAVREWGMDGVLRPGHLKRANELVDRALELDPTLAVALLAKGRILAEEGRWEEILKIGERALGAGAGSGYTYRVVSVFNEWAGHFDRAIEIAKKGIAVDPSRPRTYKALARYYQETWDFTQAEATLRAGLKRFPQESLLLRNLADFLESQDRGQEALEIRQEGLAREPNNIHWYVDLENQLRGMDRGVEADSVARLALDRFPNDARVLTWVGEHFRHQGDCEAATPLLEKALTLEPYLLLATNNLGRCLEQEKRFGDTEALYQKSIDRVPDDPEPLLKLAQFYERRGRFDEAEKILVERSKQWPERLGLLIDVAQFYNSRGRHDVAEDWARKAMAAAPDSWLPYNQLGWECWHQEKFPEARNAFLEAIRRYPNGFDNYRGLIYALNGLSLPDSEETVAETWVRQRPGHADGWQLEGWIYQSNGKMNQAAAAYEKVLELRPRSLAALNNLATFYGSIGRHEKEVDLYQRAIAVDSTKAGPWVNLGIAYFTRGDYDKALTFADKASRLPGIHDYYASTNYLTLAKAEKRLGRGEESKRHLGLARESVDRLLRDHPLDPYSLATATCVYGFAGEVEKARKYAAEAFRRQTGDPGLIYALASGLALAGDRDGAFEYLHKAVAAGFGDRRLLEEDPDLEGVRGDVRFGEVVGEVQ